MQIRRRHLMHDFDGQWSTAQNEQATELRTNGCAERVEGLCEIEPAGRSFFGTKYGDVWIRGNLQDSHACGQYNQRAQKERIGWHAGRRYKQERTQSHGEQSRN